MDAPNLFEIVQTWLQTKKSDRYVTSSNNVVCKCCKVIWIKVLNDRVRYGIWPRTSPKHEIFEILAADSKLFDRLSEVLEKAEHVSK